MLRRAQENAEGSGLQGVIPQESSVTGSHGLAWRAMWAFLRAMGWLGGGPLLGLAAADAGLAWGWAGLVLPACAVLGMGPQGRSGEAAARAVTRAVGGRGSWRGTCLGAATAVALWAALLPALPDRSGALLALGGLALLGAGLGVWFPNRRGALASLLLLGAAGLAWAPSMGGLWGAAPWSPQVAARLLGCSPATLVAEAGGLDWLRHSSVYDPVGGDSMGPSLYRPWGSLAGALPGVVGFAAGALRRLFPCATPAD